MYVEPLVSIGKAENGFLITITAPMKRDMDGESISAVDESEKVFVVDDLKMLAAKLDTLLPTLEQDDSTAMANAFKEALKND